MIWLRWSDLICSRYKPQEASCNQLLINHHVQKPPSSASKWRPWSGSNYRWTSCLSCTLDSSGQIDYKMLTQLHALVWCPTGQSHAHVSGVLDVECVILALGPPITGPSYLTTSHIWVLKTKSCTLHLPSRSSSCCYCVALAKCMAYHQSFV